MPHGTPAALKGRHDLEEKLNFAGDVTFIPELAAQYAPTYVIYIFNVGPKEHTVEKGSAGPRGGYKIPACEKGAPFSKPLILPSLCVDTYIFESEIRTHSVSGEFMAQDIVHPQLGSLWSVGNNLDELGVFWTKSNPPLDAELRTARGKLEKTFRLLLDEAVRLESTNRVHEIIPLMRYAADYFGEEHSWNKMYKKMEECPSCGAPAKEGIIIHSCGAVMPGMWAQAVARGLKTRAQAAEAAEAEAAISGNFGSLAASVQSPIGDAGVDVPAKAPAKAKAPRKKKVIA